MKWPYENAELEVVIFEFSDIVTASVPGIGGYGGSSSPNYGDMNDGGWITP